MKRGFKTLKEAELALARLKLDIANGTYKKKRAETYQEVYDLWVVQYENTVEESTFVKTTGILKIIFCLHWGSTKLKSLLWTYVKSISMSGREI
ncbi:Arm DNA-binding domain-containing protein [Lysinibacillus irui]|uniref:Arm DNA-binding domain-containing protein n=1 Tax=Lysinibacillus irui TaxID=2998077 RepID=A0ABU5NIV1_9BACI|nr:Arm DNA-binding domain-containing protein [Lysinibacillus irui]MEA0553570.1 Arm DNA-binding domain-containing protein [Lysinibacillus irui]MEA0975954.1 Arm DNA-binding domain-containing protein [Lysinibacillus irui]MEA1042108.1 Arm DNA-binding domain-containing protein [Lysinibacillus irui]